MITLHLLFVVLALFVYVLTNRAGERRRAPAAAIAWVLAITALPYLMLPLYLIFGSRKVQRSSSRPRAPPEPRHWATDILAGFGLAPPCEADVVFHRDGEAALHALWSLIEGARDRLEITTFLIADDPFGHELARRIEARVRAGVAVRVLVDGVGSLLGGLRALRLLRRAGAELRSFRPPLRLGSRPLSNLRNHRKFVIADAAIMWAGGRNLGENYFRQAAADSSWIDLSFELRGEPVLHALAQFEQDWATTRRGQRDVSVHGGRDAVPTAAALARAAGGREERARAQFVPSGPDQSHDTLYSVLLAATFRAQRRIRIVSPYFILDEALTNGLRLAALRGVGVTVVLPLRSNHRVADWARSRALRELSAAAVRVICVEAMLHAKVVLVDDDLAVCGSANFDVRSLLLNYESNLLLYGAREIGWLARWVDDVAASGRPYEARPPGLLRDIGEGLLIAIAFEL